MRSISAYWICYKWDKICWHKSMVVTYDLCWRCTAYVIQRIYLQHQCDMEHYKCEKYPMTIQRIDRMCSSGLSFMMIINIFTRRKYMVTENLIALIIIIPIGFIGGIIRSHFFSDGRILAWWRHQMETFSALLALCAGNSSVTVNSSHKGQWRGALTFSLTWVRMNGWVNNREAGDLRRHRAHYDVTVMGDDSV